MFRKVIAIGIIFLFVGVNTISFVSSRETLEKRTVTTVVSTYNEHIVDNEGDGNYTIIQDAIDNASDGDYIWVYSGNYSGDLVINKSLNIIGLDEEYLNGNDTGNPSILGAEAYIEHTSAVVFSNFSLSGIPDIDKIKIEYTNDSFILNCTADYLFLNNAYGNTIKNCEFAPKFDNFAGINLLLSSNNIITENVCTAGASETNFNVGICLQASDNNQILNNTCMANDSINIKGIDSAIHISSSKGNNISNNICWQSDIGIKIDYSENNYISRNNITTNKDKGLLLTKSNNNEITQNNFINNPKHASFKKCKGTKWSKNYWDDLTFSPKLIFGTIGPFFGLIPWINIDWAPVKEPYNIMD